MKLSELLDSLSDEELGAKCRDRYTRLMDAHARGLCDEAPHEIWNRDSATLRAHRTANDNGLEGAEPSTPAKGGASASTLETAQSRKPNQANDAASALQRHEAHVLQSERDHETAKIIPSWERL